MAVYDENDNNVVNNDEQVLNEELSNDEIDKLNESTFNLAMKKFSSYNLKWTFRSINYIINTCNISFGQLRSCVYIRDGQGYFDYIRSTINLIKAGLVGSAQFKETDTELLENRAYDIIEDWRNNFGFIGTLHLLIIHEMETKHFFMGTADQAVMNHLSSRNLHQDLIKNLRMEDLEEKLKQAQALSTTI